VRWVDGEVAPTGAAAPARVVRVALEVDPDLVGFRRKRGRDPDGSMIIDDVAFSVANRGDTARSVVVEEELRDVARPTVIFERLADGHGGTGQLLRDRWRTTLTLAPGELIQGQFVLKYRFKGY